ncbi:MAG: N-acetylmuramoyl-L-alanine amidase [Pseudomonadota bacterium]
MALTPIQHPSPNTEPRPPGIAIDHLVLHYTGMTSGAAALARLCDPAAKVSAHYLVEEDGRLFQLVDDPVRAWHAGVARWRGAKNINARSIGVEIVNPGHEHGYRDFPDQQMATVMALCQELIARHPIPAEHIVGHSDIAPWRKEDPGERFPWPWLAQAGIGVWPSPKAHHQPVSVDDAPQRLAQIGYLVEEPSTMMLATKAFQRRFRPTDISGKLDHETRVLITACAELMPPIAA